MAKADTNVRLPVPDLTLPELDTCCVCGTTDVDFGECDPFPVCAKCRGSWEYDEILREHYELEGAGL